MCFKKFRLGKARCTLEKQPKQAIAFGSAHVELLSLPIRSTSYESCSNDVDFRSLSHSSAEILTSNFVKGLFEHSVDSSARLAMSTVCYVYIMQVYGIDHWVRNHVRCTIVKSTEQDFFHYNP